MLLLLFSYKITRNCDAKYQTMVVFYSIKLKLWLVDFLVDQSMSSQF